MFLTLCGITNQMINTFMREETFFDQVNYKGIIDSIKGIYSSDGTMATLLDFERCLDEANLYAYKNWDLGELVQGPMIKRYSVACIFMWPHKMMPDPRGGVKLSKVLGCRVKVKKTEITVPIKVENYEDYEPGTHYPRMKKKQVWLVYIEISKELMDEIREGSIDLAGQNIDLNELDDSYAENLDDEDLEGDKPEEAGAGPLGMGPPPMGVPAGPPGAPPAAPGGM